MGTQTGAEFRVLSFISQYGEHDGTRQISIQYRDGGAWVELTSLYGVPLDIANELVLRISDED